MSPQYRDYPTAYTDIELSPDDGEALAVDWVLAQQEVTGGRILIYEATKSDIDGHDWLVSLARRRDVVTATPRTFRNSHWGGGTVLAAWPDVESLVTLGDSRAVKSLCALTWNMHSLEAWADGTGAECLGGTRQSTAPIIADPVVFEAVKTVTQSTSHHKNMRDTYSRDKAIHALKILRAAGYSLDPTELFAWTLANGWTGVGAYNFRKLAEEIAGGKNPRVKHSGYVPDILDHWKAEASSQVK